MLSLCSDISVSVLALSVTFLALSVTFGDTSPKGRGFCDMLTHHL